MLRQLTRPVTSAVAVGASRRLTTALTIAQLLPAGAGRVAAIYSDPAQPSYDECIAKNMASLGPELSPAGSLSGVPVVVPVVAGKSYLVSVTATKPAPADSGLDVNQSNGENAWFKNDFPVGTSQHTNVFTATGSFVSAIEYNFTGGTTFDITEFSVREIDLSACVLFSGPNVPVTYPVRAGQGKYLLKDRSGGGHDQLQVTAPARGEFSRRYNQLLATAALSTQSITTSAAQYRLSFAGTGTVTLSGAAMGVYAAGSHTITCTAGSLTLTVAGSVLTADCRLAEDVTIGPSAYQAVVSAASYDEAGYPTYWRAQTDDSAKRHMNPNGATKAVVILALQRMSYTGFPHVYMSESATPDGVNGVVQIWANSGIQYRGRAKGTSASDAQVDGAFGGTHRAIHTLTADLTTGVSSYSVNNIVAPGSSSGGGAFTEQDFFDGCYGGNAYFANYREFAPPLVLFMQPADSLSAGHLEKLQKGYAKAVGVTL